MAKVTKQSPWQLRRILANRGRASVAFRSDLIRTDGTVFADGGAPTVIHPGEMVSFMQGKPWPEGVHEVLSVTVLG